MTVKVIVYGILAEIIGENEIILKSVKDISDLKNKIINKYPRIQRYKYIVSVNKSITDLNHNLNNNDEVALIPPFAGG